MSLIASSTVPDPEYPERETIQVLEEDLPTRVPIEFVRAAVHLQRPTLCARYSLNSSVWISGRGIPGNVDEVHYSPRSKGFMYLVSYGLCGTSEAYVAEWCLTEKIESKSKRRPLRRT